MDSTGIKFTPKMQSDLAKGHSSSLRSVANYDFLAYAGAGALRSTAKDRLKFIAANLGLSHLPLQAAILKTHQPQHDTDMPEMKIGLDWAIRKQFGTEIVWHNDGTGGYRSLSDLTLSNAEAL